jgi:hypothetical protein
MGGAGKLADDEALLPQDPVDEGGLAHVGAPHHGHPHPWSGLGDFRQPGETLQHILKKRRNPQLVGGRHRVKGGETEGVEFRQVKFPAGVVDFIDYQEKGLAGGPEKVHHLGITGLGALLAVHDQEDGVGLGHRGLSLELDLAAQLVFAAHQATGVH